MRILWDFESDVFMVQKGLFFFLYKTSKIGFSRFIFTIYYMGIHGVKRGYKGFEGVTGRYMRLEEVTKDYRKLVF